MKSICEVNAKWEVAKKIVGSTVAGAGAVGNIGMTGMILKGMFTKDPPPPQAPPPQAQTINVNHINPDKPDPGTWGNIKTAAGSISDQAVAHPVMALGGAAAAGLGYLALKKMRDKQAKDV